MNLLYVPLDAILDNPFQTRRDYGDITELAESINRQGLLQTPHGRLLYDDQPLGAAEIATWCERIERGSWPLGEPLRVELAFGHRRLRAHLILAERDGFPRVRGNCSAMPVRVAPISDAEMLNMVWGENRGRAGLNAIEQAELLAAKLEQVRANGGTTQTVADAWGLSRPTVANKLRLLKLPDDVKSAVRDGQLSERQAMALLSASNDETTESRGLIDTALAAPTTNSDALREQAQPRKRRATLKLSDDVPMLAHGGAAIRPDSEMWRVVANGARAACSRCVELVGPPAPLVCRECPGVALIQTLSRAGTPTPQEAPAP